MIESASNSKHQPSFAERQMAKEHVAAERESVHILGADGVHLAGLDKSAALRLGLTRRLHIRYAHELEQTSALFAVLLGDLDETARELVHVLGVAGIGGLLETLLGLGSSLLTLGQLAALQVRRLAVEHVHRLDAVLHETNGAIEHAHEMRGRLALLVRQHAVALLPHGNQELIDAHGRVDGHLASEEVLDLVLFDSARRIVAYHFGQLMNTHRSLCSNTLYIFFCSSVEKSVL